MQNSNLLVFWPTELALDKSVSCSHFCFNILTCMCTICNIIFFSLPDPEPPGPVTRRRLQLSQAKKRKATISLTSEEICLRIDQFVNSDPSSVTTTKTTCVRPQEDDPDEDDEAPGDQTSGTVTVDLSPPHLIDKFLSSQMAWTSKYSLFPPDFSSPPPPSIPYYGSSINPTIPFRSFTCPASLLRDLNLNFHALEKSLFYETQGYFPSSSSSNKKMCHTCSGFLGDGGPKPVFHQHNSTKAKRMLSTPDCWGMYNCHQCKDTPHYFLPSWRMPLLITSSTLNDYHGTFNNIPFSGDKIHCDVLSVPGGNFKSLRRAFLAEYSNYPVPLDVICTLGLNDVANAPINNNNIAAAHVDINLTAMELRDAVLECSPEGFQNSFALCTLPFPPKFTSVTANCNSDTRLRTELLSALNNSFKSINKDVAASTGFKTDSCPLFHTYGLKCRKSNLQSAQNLGTPISATGHRYSCYREQKIENMLHLDDYTRVKMGVSVNNYFLHLYNLRASLGEDKNEGMEIKKQLRKCPKFLASLNLPIEELRAKRGRFTDPSFDRCSRNDFLPSSFL